MQWVGIHSAHSLLTPSLPHPLPPHSRTPSQKAARAQQQLLTESERAHLRSGQLDRLVEEQQRLDRERDAEVTLTLILTLIPILILILILTDTDTDIDTS